MQRSGRLGFRDDYAARGEFDVHGTASIQTTLRSIDINQADDHAPNAMMESPKREPTKKPFPILAGILAYESSWNPAFGAAFTKGFSTSSKVERLDLGIAVEQSSFA